MLKVVTLLFIFCLIIGWMLYALFGHQLIEAMYEGRSIEILNRVIERKAGFSIEFYYEKADRLFLKWSIFICLAFFLFFLVPLIIKYNPKTIFNVFIFAILCYLLFWSMLFFRENQYWQLYLIRLAILVLNIMVMTKILFSLVIKNRNLRDSLKNIILCFYSFLLCLFIFEGIFMFIPQSHGVGYTLGSRNWGMYYWKPINKFGYRDNNYDIEEVMYKKKIFVLGDSLTAGHGIKNVKDRFSNLLEKKLPPNYKVFNIASCGSDTKDAFNRLLRYPLKPDILVFQYFINDIEGAATSRGKKFAGFKPYQNVNKALKPFIKYSYLFNYIYWQHPRTDTNLYIDFLISSYNDEKIMEDHLSDLNKIVIFCKKNHIPLIVVLFPFMQDVDICEHFLASIEKFFIEKNVIAINVIDIIEKKEIPINKRVVNSNDGHPSILIHKLVAEELYKRFWM